MVFDEELDRPKSDGTFPRNLENLSVDELSEYIQELEAEIARVQADIQSKEGHKSAADSIFKK